MVRLFGRRGLALSVAALGNFLGEQAGTNAPISVKAAIGAKALTSSTTGASVVSYWIWKIARGRKLAFLVPSTLFIAGVGALLCHSLRSSQSNQASVRVELSGTPGTKLVGHYDADGTRYAVSGIVPSNVTFKARRFSYSIKKASEAGELRGDLYLDGESRGAFSTSSAGWGVSGRLDFRGPMTTSVITLAAPNDP